MPHMTLYEKASYWTAVRDNLSQSDINNAVDFEGWENSWIFWEHDSNSTPSNHPPVKPPSS